MKKRILSLILCACLVLSIVPVMNLMPATKVHAETNTYKFDAATDVAVGTDKDVIAENTAYHGYFTIKGTVTQRVSGGAVYCVEVGKNATGAIQFTVTGTADVEIQFSSTGKDNTSAVGLHDANGNLIENNEGITEVTGANNGKTEVTYSNLPAGTYRVVSPESAYNRGARVYYVTVTETTDVAHSHSLTAHPATDPTCTVAGNSAYWSCSCGKYFSDANAENEIANESWIGNGVAALGHTWDAGVVTAPTCTAAGYTTYTCTVQNCGATEQRDAVAATGHTFVDGVCACGATESTCVHEWVDGEILVAASCIADGSKEQTCSVCGETQTVSIPAGHTYVDGVCVYEGDVLTHCGAVEGSDYVHNFSEDAVSQEDVVTIVDGIFTIVGEQDTTKLDTVIYNGKTMNSLAMKMNSKLEVSFTIPTNENEGDNYDGVVILVASESRTNNKGEYVITVLKVTVGTGENTTTYEVSVPSDGIIMFAVKNGETYTITKKTGENPLYYLEYVPSATLATSNSTPEDPENPEDPEDPVDPTPDDGFVTFVAEIGSTQYLTLEAAVAAAKNGDIITLLTDTTETVTLGTNLAVGETYKICDHGNDIGGVTAADGCNMSKESCDHGGYDWIVTRNAEPEPVDPTEGYVAYIDKDDDKEYSDGDVLYDDLSEALEIAGTINGGAYVGMVNDTTETYVIIPVGVTLDIEDCILTADYVVGFNGSYVVADRINSNDAPIGKLFVNKDIILGEEAYYDKTNTVMPVWDGTLGCYVFTKLGINTAHPDSEMTIGENEEGEPAVTFIFAHLCADVTENTYLTDGGEDNKLHIVVRLEWTVDDGTAYQDFVYSEELVSSIISGGQLFKFEMTNYEELGIDPNTLTVTAMIVSDTGVIAAGETYPKVAE